MVDVHELLEYWDYEPPVHVTVAAFFRTGTKHAEGGDEEASRAPPSPDEVSAWVQMAKSMVGG